MKDDIADNLDTANGFCLYLNSTAWTYIMYEVYYNGWTWGIVSTAEYNSRK